MSAISLSAPSSLSGTAPAASDEIVRLTVTARSRAVDVTLPAQLPLAEILPGVVRTLGVLEPDEVHTGYRVLTSDGTELSLEASLLAQGTRDGAVLAVRIGADEEPPRVYDDVVEAVADVVEQQAGGWTSQASRATMLAVAGVLALLAAWTLHAATLGSMATARSAAGVVVLLTLAGAVLGKVRGDTLGALVLFGAAIAFVVVGAVSGVLGGAGAVIAAGLGAAAVGVVGLATLNVAGWPLLPAVTVGAIAAGVGGLLTGTSWPAGQVLLVVDVVLVLSAGIIPRYALELTRTAPPPIPSEAAVLQDPEPVDRVRIRQHVDLSVRVVQGLYLTLGVFHVLAAALVAASGPVGLAVSWTVSALLLLGARRAARGTDVVLAVAGGVLSIVTATVGAVATHSDWASVLAILVAVAVVGLLLVMAFPPKSPLAPARVLDVAESVLLVVLIPLAVLASGVIPLR